MSELKGWEKGCLAMITLVIIVGGVIGSVYLDRLKHTPLSDGDIERRVTDLEARVKELERDD